MIDASAFTRAARALEARGFADVAGPIIERAIDRQGDALVAAVRARGRRHRKTGKMLAKIRRRSSGRGLGRTADVRASGPIAGLVVGGTSAHDLTPIRARAMAIGARGGGGVQGFAGRAHHPGTRPDPFVRQGARDARGAITRIQDEAGAALVRELADRIERRR